RRVPTSSRLCPVYMLAIVVGAVLMVIGVGYLIATSLQVQELLFEINERLPVADKFELPWSFPQRIQLRRLQGSLMPDSPRIGKARQFRTIGFAALISGVVLLLFGLRGF